MKYTFKTGLVVEGTANEILQIAALLKEAIDPSQLPRQTGFYYSESKQQYVKISEMDSMHIRNALCKATRVYYEKLSKDRVLNNRNFLAQYTQLVSDPLIAELYTELFRRGN